MSSCLFCKIVKGEISSHIISETENTISFLDINPVSSGHLLVVSKGHFGFLHEMPLSLSTELFSEVNRLSGRVVSTLGIKDYNVLINNGSSAGQAISHVHVHIIPRMEGDGILNLGKGAKMDNEYFEQMAKALGENND